MIIQTKYVFNHKLFDLRMSRISHTLRQRTVSSTFDTDTLEPSDTRNLVNSVGNLIMGTHCDPN